MLNTGERKRKDTAFIFSLSCFNLCFPTFNIMSCYHLYSILLKCPQIIAFPWLHSFIGFVWSPLHITLYFRLYVCVYRNAIDIAASYVNTASLVLTAPQSGKQYMLVCLVCGLLCFRNCGLSRIKS